MKRYGIIMAITAGLLVATFCRCDDSTTTHIICTTAKTEFKISLPDITPFGQPVIAVLQITNTDKASTFIQENQLFSSPLSIHDSNGDEIPYTRFGKSHYDHSTKILYKGKVIPLKQYIKIINPDTSKQKESKSSENNSGASYRNRSFEIPSGHTLSFKIYLNSCYDVSSPGIYKLTVKKDYLKEKLRDFKDQPVKEISFTIGYPQDFEEFSITKD